MSVSAGACSCRTQVHVDGTRPLRIRHVLVNGVQDLLLHLGDGVTVQHLHWNLWAVFVVGVHTVEDLGRREQERK